MKQQGGSAALSSTQRVTGLGAAEVCTCAALTLAFFASFVLNAALFPAMAALFPEGREISTYAGAAFAVCVAIAAWRKPSIMREVVWSATCVVITLVAVALLYMGLTNGNRLALIVGCPLGGVGSIWLSVLIGIALAKLGPKRGFVCVAAAYMLLYAIRVSLMALGLSFSPALACMLYMAAVVAGLLLARPHAKGVLGDIHDASAPAVLTITSPASYLPFSSLIFVSILLFNVASGFSLASATQQLMPLAALLSFVPATCAFILIVLRRNLSADGLYHAAVFLVFAGFLTAPIALLSGDMLAAQAHGAFIDAGTDVFGILMYCLIAAAGSRNKLGAASIAASALAMQWVGIGIGAPIAHAVNAMATTSPATAAWVIVGVALLFMAFNYFGLRAFSFAETIEGIQPAHTDTASTDAPAPDPAKSEREETEFDAACLAVAQCAGLTARETEVFALLARGRTSPVIQEKLVLSHNTVKTHVRHVYTKLGIHSQQELISIVDEELASHR